MAMADTYDAGLFEGDIALTVEDIAEMNDLDMDVETQKIYSKGTLWPEGKVYYSFDDGFPEFGKVPVLEAMADYENSTCLTFHETTEGQRLNITHRGRGCWSFIGRLKKVQDFSLGYGCRKKGTALHELGHAIGFFHEQNRPDRDRAVIIHRDNIRENKIGNFNLKKHTNYQGEPYAFNSIMHYGIYYFGITDDPTISVKNWELYEEQGRPKLGSRLKLSDVDIRQINKAYGCYEPESTTGSLHVKVLQAGPFQDPAHYYVCVLARDSKHNEVSKCNKNDLMSTTDPEWDTKFVFEPVNPETKFYSFDITIKKGKGKLILPSQTIWVESKERSGKYYTNKEQNVLYQYTIE
ncbi:astacin-like [Halichondria panicea]|uniref:astacin-like n=1 Tax=Halichondria panicea TaxID=6063 RepID=UPI00312B31A3